MPSCQKFRHIGIPQNSWLLNLLTNIPQGFTVFAGFKNAKSEESEKLKSSASARLQILELDVTSESNIQAAANFVKNHLPSNSQGFFLKKNLIKLFKLFFRIVGDCE